MIQRQLLPVNLIEDHAMWRSRVRYTVRRLMVVVAFVAILVAFLPKGIRWGP